MQKHRYQMGGHNPPQGGALPGSLAHNIPVFDQIFRGHPSGQLDHAQAHGPAKSSLPAQSPDGFGHQDPDGLFVDGLVFLQQPGVYRFGQLRISGK